MMLVILDKNPFIAAQKLPDKIKFKQLIELAQLICSAGYCSVFEPVPQGKEIQKWIRDNQQWVSAYFSELLFAYAYHNIRMKPLTYDKLNEIYESIDREDQDYHEPKDAVFRYSKHYECNYPSNSLLPIDKAIEEYIKYTEWKKDTWNKQGEINEDTSN